MRDRTPEQTPCPSFGVLSAHVDGAVDPVVAGHVESCDRCSKLVHDIARMDGAIVAAIHAPEGLAERVKAHCRQASTKPPIPMWSASFLFRAAAAVAVAAVVISLLPGRGRTDGAQEGGTIVHAPPAPIPVHDSHGPRQPRLADPRGRPALATVGIDSDTSPKSEASPRPRVVLPSSVRHVWAVSDLRAAKAILTGLLPAGVSLRTVSEESDRFVLQVFLMDRDLQGLVDRLDGAGWDLLSPSAPQPGLGDQLRTTGGDVRYDIDLVQGSK